MYYKRSKKKTHMTYLILIVNNNTAIIFQAHKLYLRLLDSPPTSGLDVISLTRNRKCYVLGVLALPVDLHSDSDQNKSHDRRNSK